MRWIARCAKCGREVEVEQTGDDFWPVRCVHCGIAFRYFRPELVWSLADKVKASPTAHRLAAEAGIDLADVAGTGAGGMVVKADVESALADREGGSNEAA